MKKEKETDDPLKLLIELQPRNVEGRVSPLISPLQVNDVDADRQTYVTTCTQSAPLKETCFVQRLEYYLPFINIPHIRRNDMIKR